MSAQNYKVYIEDLIKELNDLGISSQTIQEKSSIDLYMAKSIVERYSFGRELKKEEKRGLIEAILAPTVLNNLGQDSLYFLVEKLRKYSFSDQDVYGIIINLAVNGRIIDEKGCSYSDFLKQDINAFQTIKNDSARVEKCVSPFTVIIAASECLSEEEQRGLKTWFVSGGKDIRHVYVAKRMIEEYLPNQHKRDSIMFKLLELEFKTNSREAKRNTERNFLEALEPEMSRKEDPANVGESQGESSPDILFNRLEKDYNINREFLEQKSSDNIARAEEIVNGAIYGIGLTIEGKRALLLKLLSSKSFGGKMPNALSIMMDNFQQIGFSKQDTCGVMINLFALGITLDSHTYEYWDFLCTNKNDAWKTIKDKKDYIKTTVIIGPLTMRRLMGTAVRTMRNAVAKGKETGEIDSQIHTRKYLEGLARGSQRDGGSVYDRKIP